MDITKESIFNELFSFMRTHPLQRIIQKELELKLLSKFNSKAR